MYPWLTYLAGMMAAADDETKVKIMSAVPEQYGVNYTHTGHLVLLFDQILPELQRLTDMPTKKIGNVSYTEYLASLFSLATEETKTNIVESVWLQLGVSPCKYPEEQAAIIDGFIAEVQRMKTSSPSSTSQESKPLA